MVEENGSVLGPPQKRACQFHNNPSRPSLPIGGQRHPEPRSVAVAEVIGEGEGGGGVVNAEEALLEGAKDGRLQVHRHAYHLHLQSSSLPYTVHATEAKKNAKCNE